MITSSSTNANDSAKRNANALDDRNDFTRGASKMNDWGMNLGRDERAIKNVIGGNGNDEHGSDFASPRVNAMRSGSVNESERATPRFSSLLFASPANARERGNDFIANGLTRVDSAAIGNATPKTSGGSNRYFGGSGTRSRGQEEGRATAAHAPVIGGVSSRGTPLFTRTEIGQDDHTPGFLRRAMEKTHAETTAANGKRSEEALNAWLGASEDAAGTTAHGAAVTFGRLSAEKAKATTSRAVAGEVLSDAEAEHWVTVYGFTRDEKSLVLREFQRDGDIVNFGTFSDVGASSNWLHVRFATKESARRAMRRNGQTISGIMVGVKSLDEKSKADISSGGAGEGLISRGGSQVRRVAPSRDGITIQPRQRTTMDKVVEFVFGA